MSEKKNHRITPDVMKKSAHQKAASSSALIDARIRELRDWRGKLQANDRVQVSRFGQAGRVIRADAKKQVALVSVGLGQWEVPFDELFPLDRA